MPTLRLGAATIALFALLSGTATAEDPAFVDWTSLLPTFTAGYDPSSSNDCKKGHDNCVHAVIREMDRRFDKLVDDCDHDLIFAVSYLRTTEEYHRAAHEPGFFEDTNFVNHEDAVFAEYYFQAFDDWHKGRQDQVPAAWKVAFQAAENKELSSYGNAVLGMNAHINRDLAFVLYEIGLIKPDGSTRKTDHDKVNEFLNRVSDALYPEIAQRFDPTFDDTDIQGTTADNAATFQSIPAWRERAWRNAERLANAQSAAERAQISQEIEDLAYAQALQMKTTSAYGPLRNSADRDAFCQANRYNWPA